MASVGVSRRQWGIAKFGQSGRSPFFFEVALFNIVFNKELPPHLVVQNPSMKGHKAYA
ncbi:hypothetical protein PIB30_093975, partial [Stylosanthes scabra]|nr:hypothetical protein [Stylosanthes scabra]